MLENNAETETDEKIVLALPRAFATIGDPTDEGRERVFDLEPPNDGEEFRRLEFDPDEWDVARAILREHDHVDVVADPTDRGLDDVRSKREIEAEWARREYEKKEKERARVQAFDPAEDRPTNTQKIRIKNTYEALLDAGEKEAAAELRGLETDSAQDTAAREMRRELLGDEHAQHARR